MKEDYLLHMAYETYVSHKHFATVDACHDYANEQVGLVAYQIMNKPTFEIIFDNGFHRVSDESFENHGDEDDHEDDDNPYFLNSEEIEELIHFKKWLGGW